ncbi:MAG TPA: hypothetical protein PKI70_06370 [Mesotoga sp.]|nr:hypothetical protein [Mesotoga sp.]
MVAFDATMMLLLMFPDKVDKPKDSKTGLPVEYAEARIEALIKFLEKGRTKIIVPTPALSELLVRAGDDTMSLVERINKDSNFTIEPFDTRSAIEVAIMARKDIKGDKKSSADPSVLTKAKIKYDRQIVAVAKVNSATILYSDDEHMIGLCKAYTKIEVKRLEDLPVPKEESQEKIPFPDKVEGPKEVDDLLDLEPISHEEEM